MREQGHASFTSQARVTPKGDGTGELHPFQVRQRSPLETLRKQLAFPQFGNPFSRKWPWMTYWAYDLAQFTARYGRIAGIYKRADYVDFVIMLSRTRRKHDRSGREVIK